MALIINDAAIIYDILDKVDDTNLVNIINKIDKIYFTDKVVLYLFIRHFKTNNQELGNFLSKYINSKDLNSGIYINNNCSDILKMITNYVKI